MRISNQCSTALHMLALMAVCPDMKLTSRQLAKSIGSDPVVIRSLLLKLKSTGLVDTFRGTGGSVLLRKPEEISVWQVYTAVDPESLEHLIGLHPNPYEGCPVGRNIYDALKPPYDRIKEAIKREMMASNLEEIICIAIQKEGCTRQEFIDTCQRLLSDK